MYTPNKIDLNTCKSGQKLIDRDGNIYTYDAPTDYDAPIDDDPFIHVIIDPFQYDTHRWGNGRLNKSFAHNYDIVSILPLEPEVKEDPSTTPRTDEVAYLSLDSDIEDYYIVPADLARQLETELNQANDDKNALIKGIKDMITAAGLAYMENIKAASDLVTAVNKNKPMQSLTDEQRALNAGWYIETNEDNFPGYWVSPDDGMHYDLENVIKQLDHRTKRKS